MPVNAFDQKVVQTFEAQKYRLVNELRFSNLALTIHPLDELVRAGVETSLHRIELALLGREVRVEKVAEKNIERYPATAKDAILKAIVDFMARHRGWPYELVKALWARIKWTEVAQAIHVHHMHMCPHLGSEAGQRDVCIRFIGSSDLWEGSSEEYAALRKIAAACADDPSYWREHAEYKIAKARAQRPDYSRFFQPPEVEP